MKTGDTLLHFKGGRYTFIDYAKDANTDEDLVIYRPQYGAQELWVRSLANFAEMVEREGVLVPRFRLVSPGQENGDPES